MKTFLNLTNGLEYSGHFDGFVRIQSTWCEQKRWPEILQDLDNNLLMWLALGEHCYVVDAGRKVKTRAVWQGVEWIRYALYRAWFSEDYRPVGRASSMRSLFYIAYEHLPDTVCRKLDYYKRYLNCTELHLYTHCVLAHNEGNYTYYAKRAKSRYEAGNEEGEPSVDMATSRIRTRFPPHPPGIQ